MLTQMLLQQFLAGLSQQDDLQLLIRAQSEAMRLIHTEMFMICQWRQLQKAAGEAPDLLTYSMLLRICKNTGRFIDTMSVFREMVASKIVPDLPTFHVILVACENRAALSDILEVHGAMETCKAHPDVKACDMLARLAESCGGGRDLVQHYRSLPTINFQP